MAPEARSDPGSDLSAGQLAARSGVNVSTLHFYEAQGLIASRRTAGNQRRYHRGTLRRVAVIKVAQRAGVSLREIADALSTLPANTRLTASHWARMSTAWKRDLDARIAALSALRDQLGDCIGCGCLSLDACPLRNPSDHLASRGPGPRLLDCERAEPGCR